TVRRDCRPPPPPAVPLPAIRAGWCGARARSRPARNKEVTGRRAISSDRVRRALDDAARRPVAFPHLETSPETRGCAGRLVRPLDPEEILSHYRRGRGLLAIRGKIPIRDEYMMSLVYGPGVGAAVQ